VSVLPSNLPSFLPSLNPTSTNSPTFYECSCELGHFKFNLELKTDHSPQQTSWEIRDATGTILFSIQYDLFYDANDVFNYDYCLPVGCYTFVISDDNRDGICCANHPYYDDGDFDDDDYLESIDGYYKGSIYGRKVTFSGGEFGRQATESFCGENVCPFATRIPSLSPSVSSLPSSAPTLLPSQNPTISSLPSSHPTLLPSQNPTTHPTTSQNPTSSSAPTFYDCSCEPGQFKFGIQLKTDEYPEETSWEVQNGSGDVLFTNEILYNESFKVYNHDYCLDVGCYDFMIYDDYGDGICCGFDEGYYEGLLYGIKEVFSGGEFGFNETQSFCGEDVCA